MDTDLNMDSDISQGNNQHFNKFADALKSFITDSFDETNQSNAFDIVKEFRSIAGESALAYVDNVMDLNEKVEYSNWELEARFWHLFELLLNFRTADEDPDNELEIYSYNSNTLFEKNLLHKNKDLYQIWIIIVWLQENIKIQERPDNLPISKWSNSLLSGSLKSADLDSPLRDPTTRIDPRDKEQDNIFYKYIYELLLAGNFEEAYEECKLSDNVTLSIILCGMQGYLNPNIDTQLADEFISQQGVKKHALWRRTVSELANTPQLDIYERAIYNFLSGTIPNDDVLEQSNWESELLLNLNQIFHTKLESNLISSGRINTSELVCNLPSKSLSLQDTLDRISSHHRSESEHPIRVLMGATIMNTLDSLLHSSVTMLLGIVKGYETSNDLLDEPYLLRIVTHLAILLDIIVPGSVEKDDKVKLITAYISILKLYGLYDSIPVYICFLEEEDALEAYSFILCTLDDKDERAKQLQLMNFLNLPTANILRRTTQRVFSETEEEYSPRDDITITFENNNIDNHLINAVEWLFEGKLYLDAMDSTIAIARRFLINGKIMSLQKVMHQNSIENLINIYKLEKLPHDDIIEDDANVKEIVQYENLVNGFKMYEEWQKSVKQLNSESNIPSLIEKFQEYSKNTLILIKSFLVELTDDKSSPDFSILYEIRSLYTPYLVIALHKGLVEASRLLKIPTFINDALRFTSLVANETDSIYLLFQTSGKLKEYLQLVAHTATMVENE